MKRKLECIICLICIAAITFSGCSLGKTKSAKMVDTLFSNNKFMFRGIEWLSSEQQVLKLENIKKKNTKEISNAKFDMKTIISSNKISFKELDWTISTVYTFKGGKFIQGGYYSTFDDMSKFSETTQKVINALKEKFGDPVLGNEWAQESTVDKFGQAAIWNAEGGTQLQIGVPAKRSGMPYELVIYVRTREAYGD